MYICESVLMHIVCIHVCKCECVSLNMHVHCVLVHACVCMFHAYLPVYICM